MTEPTARSRPASGGRLGGGPADVAAAEGIEVEARSQWSYARRRFLRHRLAMIGLIGLVIIFGAGALAPWVAPYTFDQIDLTNVLQAPTTVGHHFFGTDEIGRDYLSRVIYGIRTSEQVGSRRRGRIDPVRPDHGRDRRLLPRLGRQPHHARHRLFLTIPVLVMLLVTAALLGAGNQWLITGILAAFFWTPIARIVRGVFLSLREKEYVEAAKAVGAGDLRIMFRHILPNTLGPIIVNATLTVADAIITEAFLSFLGQGIKPPTPSLGVLVAGGQQFPQDWWLTVLPGLVLVLIVVCVNFVGDGLRDALDPQQRRVRA